jgi:serine/threonine protein kinase
MDQSKSSRRKTGPSKREQTTALQVTRDEMNTKARAEDVSTDRLQPGEHVGSRYHVLGLWRNHPLGEIYKCIDETDGRVVTLQRLRREFAEPGVGDRLFDTRGCAALGGRLLVDLLDYGVDLDGRPFLVGPWIAADTVADLARPLRFVDAAQIVMSVANALISAHAERRVHGGIVPSSVLVSNDTEGRLRTVGILGFGLVPALDAGVGKCRSLPLWTAPCYAAPELIGGAPLSPAVDVYALGVLMWELLFGAPPFRGPTLKVLDAHLNRALPDRPLPVDVPPAFDWVLRRMLAKNPVDRFADAAAVVGQLRIFREESTEEIEEFEIIDEVADEVEDDDDERTLIFERVGVSVHVEDGDCVDDRPVELVAAPNRAKRIALICAAATLVIVAWLGLSRASLDASLDAAEESPASLHSTPPANAVSRYAQP